jgi:hypothetical protein
MTAEYIPRNSVDMLKSIAQSRGVDPVMVSHYADMTGGNPGACTAVIDHYLTDPQHWKLNMDILREKEITGTRIWVLYKYVCKRDPQIFSATIQTIKMAENPESIRCVVDEERHNLLEYLYQH